MLTFNFAEIQSLMLFQKHSANLHSKKNASACKFLNNLMLVARFFIYLCKYSKSKTNMLEYFNELNMNKKSEYIIAKRNKS